MKRGGTLLLLGGLGTATHITPEARPSAAIISSPLTRPTYVERRPARAGPITLPPVIPPTFHTMLFALPTWFWGNSRPLWIGSRGSC